MIPPNGITDSEGLEETAPVGAVLSRYGTVYRNLSVRKLKIIRVHIQANEWFDICS